MQLRPDVALQLPPGAGKTIVGGTIAEWRRRRFGERVVYACASKLLAKQTAAMLKSYGMDCVLLVGNHRDWPAGDRLKYTSAQVIAVTTYWSIFNAGRPLEDVQLLILDDAHAAESAVSSPWAITVERTDPAYYGLLTLLKDTLDPLVVSRLRAEVGGQHTGDVHLASAVGVAAKANELGDFLRRSIAAGAVNEHVKYAMRLMEAHLDRTLVYASRRAILIRPFIAPTASLAAFAEPTQRVYMSATLGEGGELERTFGREKIDRLPLPTGWDRRGNGRRFVAFPESTSDLSAANKTVKSEFIKKIIAKLGRTVVLTPDTLSMEAFLTERVPKDVPVFRPKDVEDSLDGFTKATTAVLGMANRYDGLDLPDNACRLVILAGLPARGDLQERFIAGGLGAIDVLQERIRARITQGAGRATRNPTDYAAVLVLGTEITTFVGRRDVQAALHPELHAEVKFGLDSSLGSTSAELLDLFDHFLAQDVEWKSAEPTITSWRDSFEPIPPAGTLELERSASFEVAAWQALWQGEWDRARDYARRAIDALRGGRAPQRYAALWNYFFGSWTTIQASREPGAVGAEIARAAFAAARSGARGTVWLSHLASPADKQAMTGSSQELDQLDSAVIDAALGAFDKMRRPATYEPLISEIRAGLAKSDARPFEAALVKLGSLAGATSSVGDGGATAMPDASWDFSDVVWITWEAKSDSKPSGEVDVSAIDQTNRHLRSISDRVGRAVPSGSVSILTTPQTKVHPAANAVAEDHSHIVNIAFVQDLAVRLDSAWRSIKSTVAPDADDDVKRQAITNAFRNAGALPTQWLTGVSRIRSTEG